MTPPETSSDGGLSLADWKQIDAACDRFEDACRGGERPALEPLLAEVSAPARARLLRELLPIDLEFSRVGGEKPDVADYHARFPEYHEIIEEVFGFLKTLTSLQDRDAREGDRATSLHHITEIGRELPRAELPPDVLDALRTAGYEVLGELGRGGMGIVYLARRVMLNRLCALKMILAGAHAGAEASHRFRAEAETIARLSHPNIVQIYHIGRAGDLPFVELEYLAGGSLDKTLKGTPWPATEAAGLVAVLARAIAEAHRQGVVHRDLKPANILLDTDGCPKVADFGLAKILDSDDGLTKTHMVLGSPSYMAPEQAEGRLRLIGPTTDVYALGTILYELLTGRPPFRAATALETLALVKETDPVPPSQLQPGLPRDVATICLKCLEKIPARRYPTAEALAEDLRRYLSHEPIRARPASPWEQALKWSRRRPTSAASLTITAVALVLLLVGAWSFNARLWTAVRKAQTAEQVAAASSRAALEQRNLALKALDQLVYDVQEKLGETPETRPLRRSLLDTAIRGLDEIARGTEASAPDLSRAVAHQKLGDIFRQIGRTEDARRQLVLARQLAEQLAAAAPRDLAIAECLIKAHSGLGALNIADDQPREAKDNFRHVVDLAEGVVAAAPTRAGAREGLLEAYLALGRAYGFAGEFAAGEVWFRKIQVLAEGWAANEPDNRHLKDLLASSYRKLADMRKFAKDPEAARRDYLRAIATGKELLAAEPGNIEFKTHLALALRDLAGVESTQQHLAEARPLLLEAERLNAELVAADRENLQYQLWLIYSQTDLAKLERDEFQFAKAEDLFRRTLDRVVGLRNEGRLEGRPRFRAESIRTLRQEIADCQAAIAALGNLDEIRSRPAREASRMLPNRARLLTAQGRHADAVAAVEALCDLEAEGADDLYELAHGLAAGLVHLEGARSSDASLPARPARSQRYVERVVVNLARAVERGFKDLPRMEGDEALKVIHEHPAYRRLVERLKGQSAPPVVRGAPSP